MDRFRAIGLLLTAVLAGLAAACTPTAAAPAWTFTPASSAAPGAATSGPGGAVLGTVELSAIDIAYEPAHVVVPKAGKYEVKLVNKGTISHDITFADGKKLFMGSSGTGAPKDGRDPTEGGTKKPGR